MEYSFEYMVNEAYQELDKDPNEAQTLILPDIVTTIEPTRMIWVNVKDYLRVIRRRPEHFINFLRNEKICKGEINWMSGSISDGLVLHDKFRKNTIISEMALKYVNDFVVCTTCKRADSLLIKEKESKLHKFECNNCGMTKYM